VDAMQRLRRNRQLAQTISFNAKGVIHNLVGRVTPCAPPVATRRAAGRGLPALSPRSK
jgi:hypothetical protein